MKHFWALSGLEMIVSTWPSKRARDTFVELVNLAGGWAAAASKREIDSQRRLGMLTARAINTAYTKYKF